MQRDLGNGVQVEITPTCSSDTLMVLTDGTETCLNLNDALHAAPPSVQTKIIADLQARYPSIDYLYCGYGIASHFPCCYDIPGKDDVATAIKRQKFFNRQWCPIVDRLRAGSDVAQIRRIHRALQTGLVAKILQKIFTGLLGILW